MLFQIFQYTYNIKYGYCLIGHCNSGHSIIIDFMVYNIMFDVCWVLHVQSNVCDVMYMLKLIIYVDCP